MPQKYNNCFKFFSMMFTSKKNKTQDKTQVEKSEPPQGSDLKTSEEKEKTFSPERLHMATTDLK